MGAHPLSAASVSMAADPSTATNTRETSCHPQPLCGGPPHDTSLQSKRGDRGLRCFTVIFPNPPGNEAAPPIVSFLDGIPPKELKLINPSSVIRTDKNRRTCLTKPMDQAFL